MHKRLLTKHPPKVFKEDVMIAFCVNLVEDIGKENDIKKKWLSTYMF